MGVIKEDTENIKNILNGNSIEQKKFYDRYKEFIRKFLIKNYTDNDIDDDISEIIIKIITNINSYDENKSSFNTWIISICKNHMIDKYRAKSNGKNNMFVSTYTTNISNLNTNYNNIDVSQSVNWCDTISTFEIENTLNYLENKISSNDFTLLNMKYKEGFNYKEIGDEFNVSSETVSNRVNYVKGKLKKYLTDELK